MTGLPFPELRIAAAVETGEAVAANMEDAVRFTLGSVLGNEDAAQAPFASGDDCVFEIGTSSVFNLVEDLLQTICLGFRSLTLRFIDVAGALADSIRAFIEPFLANVVREFTALVTTVTTRLADAVFAVVDRVEQVVRTIVDTLSALTSSIIDAVRSVVDQLGDILTTIFDRVSVVVNAILGKLRDGFTALLAGATAVLDRIGTGVSSIITALIAAVLSVLNKIGSGISSLLETLTGAAEGGLAKVREVIESIPEAIREVFAEAKDFIGDAVGKPLASIGDIFITQVEAFFARLIDDLEVSPENILREFLTGLGIPLDAVELFAASADRAMPRTPAIFALGSIMIIPLVLGPLVNAILAPATIKLSHSVSERFEPTLISPADAINALFRGEMSAEKFREDLGKAGYSPERQGILLRSSRRLLDLSQMFRWWLRDIIPEEELDRQLEAERISDDDKARLKESVFFIPPVGDLIRMAVREVFSPEIRERFGQDEGFPEEFATFGKQQGISEFWARAYWAAHWVLPSAQQGFEMLHRKVITAEDLDLLLRAQDVMPFWREKLTQIAFNPLTRVDLRRMHKLGLLDEEQLQLRYEDLGFAPDNAALMVQFTLAFNFDDTSEAAAEIEGLTRATVVNMFEDGILAEGEALQILELMGLSNRVASLFIEQRKFEVSRAERSALIESIISLVGGGVINFPTAQDSLASIGLTATEIAKATQRILAKFGGRKRLPTPVQLEKMLQLGIIDEDLWRETMGGLDFPKDWTERLLTLSQSGGTA